MLLECIIFCCSAKPVFFPLQANTYGFNNVTGCLACNCNPSGSLQLQCNESGICSCRNQSIGARCDACQADYFGLPVRTCQGTFNKIYFKHIFLFWEWYLSGAQVHNVLASANKSTHQIFLSLQNSLSLYYDLPGFY